MCDKEKYIENEEILCTQCYEHSAFPTLRQLISHMKQTENHQPVCHPCDVTFKNYKHYAGHVKVYHLLKNKNCEIPCEFCGKCFLTRNLLKGHYNSVHAVEDNLICNLCSRPYQNMKKLRLHTMKCLISSPQFAEYHQQETLKLKLEEKNMLNLEQTSLNDNLRDEKGISNNEDNSDDNESENEDGELQTDDDDDMVMAMKEFDEWVKEEDFTELEEYSNVQNENLVLSKSGLDRNTHPYPNPASHIKKEAVGEEYKNENISADSDLVSESHECNECESTFLTKKKLYLHHYHVHKLEPSLCDICSKVFKNSSILRSHRRQVHNINFHLKKSKPKGRTPPTVKICPICAAGVKYLEQHITSQHSDLPPESHECTECPKTFPTKKKLYLHHYNAHKQEPSLCDICCKVFKNSSILKSHKRQVHENKPKPPPKQIAAPCPICAKILANSCSWQKHIRLVHGNGNMENSPQVSCDECGKMFANEVYMEHHKRRTHDIEPSDCDLCNGNYKNKRALQRHKRYAHSGKDNLSPSFVTAATSEQPSPMSN